MRASRREFLFDLGLMATGVATSAALSACGGDSGNCSCEDQQGSPGGGASGTGGATSGIASGGSATGSSANSGSANSGNANGGSANSGNASGGNASGGNASGGSASGDVGGTATTAQTGGSGTGGTQASSSGNCPPVTQCATPAVLPSDWAREADVIVLGTGFAGLATAIAAADAGAKVLILEKMSQSEEGGNSKVSGNMWWTPTSASDGVTYIKALCAGLTDDTCIQTLASEMATLNTYLGTLGVSPSALGVFQPEYPELSASSTVRTWSNGSSGTLWQALRNAVTSRKIDVLYQTPAVDLIQDPSTREVKGVIAASDGKNINIKCKRGLVMACGGFEFDYDMQAQYLPGWPVFSHGSPGNTGDGVRMGLKAGAALWHMNNALAHVGCFVATPTDPKSIPIPLSINSSCILVDKFGSRFMNEQRTERHGFGHKEYLFFFDGLKQAFTRLPCYAVFDETGRKAGKLQGGLAGWFGNHKTYTWSSDNSAEVSSGWIKKAQTLDALATAIGADAATLNATITRYNALCTAGKDDDFGRAASSLKALSTAPYYALPIYPLMYNTQGGPRRNEKCQVVTPTGGTIPRLYSAGELGSFWGWMYNGGGNASEAVITGRIAGANAAGQGPWA
ncbi:MAG TPA: FAD-dependent oxidoreductase, partial [Polyangiaceae bacterium]